jgi:hypothetical protein
MRTLRLTSDTATDARPARMVPLWAILLSIVALQGLVLGLGLHLVGRFLP